VFEKSPIKQLNARFKGQARHIHLVPFLLDAKALGSKKLLAVKSIALKMIIFLVVEGADAMGKSILARRKRNLKDYDEGCVVFVWCLLIVYIIG
jgi:hypothetical protein